MIGLQGGQNKFETQLGEQLVDLVVLLGNIKLELTLNVLRFFAQGLEPRDTGHHIRNLLAHGLELLISIFLLELAAREQLLNLSLSFRNVFDCVALGDIHGPPQILGLIHNARFELRKYFLPKGPPRVRHGHFSLSRLLDRFFVLFLVSTSARSTLLLVQ